MIELRIVSKSQKKIEQVAELLLNRSLAIDLNVLPPITRFKKVKGKLKKSTIYMMTAKTKALLFSKIDELLKNEYNGHMPELYSVPITYMDFDQTKTLRHDVADV